MQVASVLLMTHDNALFHHWEGLGDAWLPARGAQAADLDRWRARGNQLVVLDADLPGLSAWQPTDWQAAFSKLKVVVASMRPGDQDGQRVLTAGAVGYIHAYMPIAGIEQVLQHVSNGEIWVGHSMLSRMIHQISQRMPAGAGLDWTEGLTAREQEVARYVALGHGNQSIADSMGISERTVRAHLSAIFEKLNVTDRLSLALRVHGVDRRVDA
ncbi:MAG: response regulator transcription factor, partial [Alcaligenaceae bacterium]|nr:response regulator transcription factor [Alcaligenaceae bacterium]